MAKRRRLHCKIPTPTIFHLKVEKLEVKWSKPLCNFRKKQSLNSGHGDRVKVINGHECRDSELFEYGPAVPSCYEH